MTLRRCLTAFRVVVGVGAWMVACSDSVGPAKGAPAPVVESVEHEPCTLEGHKVERFDTRSDGKAVVTKVLDGSGHELCRISDINHDGKPDLFEYFDASGRVRRREADYDANGSIDAVESYEDGKLVKREYDTTGQHRVDTWDYFDKATGKRTKRERDTTNDGRVDQWWTWSGDRITIVVDRNGDGQPDPDSTLVLDEKTGTEIKDSKDAKTAPPAAAEGGAPSSPAPAGSASASTLPPPPPPPEIPSASPPAGSAPASATKAAGATK